jgi:hypothetical protein
MAFDHLAKVRRLRERRANLEQEWRDAIREAHADGNSLREIAAAAHLSHVRILQIVRGD